jgi:hypothetical protein
MGIIMEDPVHLETPSRSPVRPTASVDARTAFRKRELSFELESPGGHRRTVTGTIAYLDESADTYMVRTRVGKLIRAPLREIKRTFECVA